MASRLLPLLLLLPLGSAQLEIYNLTRIKDADKSYGEWRCRRLVFPRWASFLISEVF
jgi:hypothetical protein